MSSLSTHSERLLQANSGEEKAPALFVWMAKLMDRGDVDLFESWLATNPEISESWQDHSALSWLLALRPDGAPEGGAADQMILAFLTHYNHRQDPHFKDLASDVLHPHLLSQALQQRAMTVATCLVGPKYLGRLPSDIQAQLVWPGPPGETKVSLIGGARRHGEHAFRVALEQQNWPAIHTPLDGTAFLNYMLAHETKPLAERLSACFPEVWDAQAHHESLSERDDLTPLEAWGLLHWRQADLGKFRNTKSQRDYARLRHGMENWLKNHGPQRLYTPNEAASLWLFASKSTRVADPHSWVPLLAQKSGVSEQDFLVQTLISVNQVSRLKRLPESALEAMARLYHEWTTLAQPSDKAWAALRENLRKLRMESIHVEHLPDAWRTWLFQQSPSLWVEDFLQALPQPIPLEKMRQDLHEQGWWRDPNWYAEALSGPLREQHMRTLTTYAPEVLAHFRQQQISLQAHSSGTASRSRPRS